MNREIGCVLAILCFCGVCQAQQVLSSGGYAVKSDVSVNWILGGSLSDIHPVGISQTTQGLNEQLPDSCLTLKVYPLPASDFLNIEIAQIDSDKLI